MCTKPPSPDLPHLHSLDNLLFLNKHFESTLRKKSLQEYEHLVVVTKNLYAKFNAEKKKKHRCIEHIKNLAATITKHRNRLQQYNKHTYQCWEHSEFIKDTWPTSTISTLFRKRSILQADIKASDTSGVEKLCQRIKEFNTLLSNAFNEFSYRYLNKNTKSIDFSSDNVEYRECNCESKAQQKIMLRDDSFPVCSTCGVVVGSNSKQNILSIGDIYKMYPIDTKLNIVRPKIRYKRLNHFKETLKQLQGLTVTVVPIDVMMSIKSFLERKCIPLHSVTPFLIRDILQQIKESKYYEHSVSITTAISKDFVPIRISSTMQMQMLLMFLELERVFPKAIEALQSTRKNFISYHFTLSRICALLGIPGIASSARMLKSRKLFLEQERVWKEMCKLLHWPDVVETDIT